MNRECTIDGCTRQQWARTWCNMHYSRWRNWKGDDPSLDPVARRFWRRVNKMPDGCWVWTGVIDRKGYGQVGVGKRNFRAHRWSWATLRGEHAPGLVLDHLCRNRRCVNPDHLEPVTMQENLKRGIDPAAAKRAREGCPRGHPFDDENTYHWAGQPGARHCRACRRIRDAERRALTAGGQQ